MISLLSPKKTWTWFWTWPLLAEFLPKQGVKKAICKSSSNFFQNYSIITLTYHNGNQQKNPKWVDLMGKIWPNLTTEDNINEAPLTWSVSPWKNRMMEIKNFHRVGQSNNMVLQACDAVKLWHGFFKDFYM